MESALPIDPQDKNSPASPKPPPEPAFLKRLGKRLPERGRVLIVPHDYPDPDALASAAAMELLLAHRYGLRAQVAFTGEVSRAENKELLKQIRYRWRDMGSFRTPRQPVPCILVDTSPWAGNVTLPSWLKPVAVIDHHVIPRGAQPGKLLTCIEPDVGATATLMWEFLTRTGLAPPRWMATVLLYAIITETMDFSREVTERDTAAYTELTALANLVHLGRIRNAPLPRSYFVQLQEAMSNAILYGRVAWTRLGKIEQPELVGEFADLLLRMERVTWSFCLGELGDRILVSLRSCRPGARCGRLLRRTIGKQGSAGGHDALAAGYLEGAGKSPEERRVLEESFIRALVSRIETRSRFTRTRGTLTAQKLADLEKVEGNGQAEPVILPKPGRKE